MRKLLIVCGFALLTATCGKAQEKGSEVSGDYQYVRINPGGGAPTSNCQGGAGSFAGYLNRWVGVVGEFGGCKVTGLPAGASARQINYLGGPRIVLTNKGRLQPFAQALFGGARATASVSGLGSASTNAFAAALGGGADVQLTQSISFRAIQFDYFYTHFGGQGQNNLRLQSGIVFRFGR
jgi:opacity protein-like surface antigen